MLIKKLERKRPFSSLLKEWQRGKQEVKVVLWKTIQSETPREIAYFFLRKVTPRTTIFCVSRCDFSSQYLLSKCPWRPFFLFPSTYTFCFGLSVWKLKPDIQYKWMEKKERKKRNTNKNKNAVQPMESTTTGKEGEKERERDLSIFFSNKGAFFFFVCVCCCCCFACLFVCLTRLSKSVRWSCWEHVGSNEHVSVRICVMKLRDTSEQNKKKKEKKGKTRPELQIQYIQRR